mmetsp:Transcript_86978/g.151785  ORF Transcript_86978/g.151785 Transcript_86978/m.151785 type:complete len:272 (-) Transcript_86978:252-1067(-)
MSVAQPISFGPHSMPQLSTPPTSPTSTSKPVATVVPGNARMNLLPLHTFGALVTTSIGSSSPTRTLQRRSLSFFGTGWTSTTKQITGTGFDFFFFFFSPGSGSSGSLAASPFSLDFFFFFLSPNMALTSTSSASSDFDFLSFLSFFFFFFLSLEDDEGESESLSLSSSEDDDAFRFRFFASFFALSASSCAANSLAFIAARMLASCIQNGMSSSDKSSPFMNLSSCAFSFLFCFLRAFARFLSSFLECFLSRSSLPSSSYEPRVPLQFKMS